MKLLTNDECNTCKHKEVLECNDPCNLCIYNPRRKDNWEISFIGGEDNNG